MNLALVWDDWLLMAWLVPLSIAISGVIDVLMVQRRVYANAHEAAAEHLELPQFRQLGEDGNLAIADRATCQLFQTL